MLIVIGSVAQFEREVMLERQREGIAKVKREGEWGGAHRPPAPRLTKSSGSLARAVMREEIAARLGVGVPRSIACWPKGGPI